MGRKAKDTMVCCRCGKEQTVKEFFASGSIFNNKTQKIPYCKTCVAELYDHYVMKYKTEGNVNPEKKAIQRLCMAFDTYYTDELYKQVLDSYTNNYSNSSLLNIFFKMSCLTQNLKKNYDFTWANDKELIRRELAEEESERKIKLKTIKMFGKGFSKEDYEFLENEYEDWTTRHECNTKAQEEVFKQICFNQLELYKATVQGLDTKDLRTSFQKLLETANLQPKQNKKDTVSEAQTFGTLIDKWETTRPIPEVDPDLADVDKIGLYIDTFFRGHLAKMMGLKNGLSRLYDKYMKKYTVNKPEYSDDTDSEILFDSIFGNPKNMEDE